MVFLFVFFEPLRGASHATSKPAESVGHLDVVCVLLGLVFFATPALI